MKVILTLAALAAVLAEPELKDSGLKVKKYLGKQIRSRFRMFYVTVSFGTLCLALRLIANFLLFFMPEEEVFHRIGVKLIV